MFFTIYMRQKFFLPSELLLSLSFTCRLTLKTFKKRCQQVFEIFSEIFPFKADFLGKILIFLFIIFFLIYTFMEIYSNSIAEKSKSRTTIIIFYYFLDVQLNQLNGYKFRRYMAEEERNFYLITINTVLGSFLYGYCLVNMSVLGPIYSLDSGLPQFISSIALGILTACLPLTAIIGSYLAFSLSNWIKIRYLMVYLDIMSIIAIIIQNYALSFIPLLIGRLILGVAIGINSVIIPKYIYSVCPLSMAGELGSFNQLFIVIGITVGYSMGFFSNWHFLISLPAVTCATRALLFLIKFQNDIPFHRKKDSVIRKLESYYYRIRQYLEPTSRLSVNSINCKLQWERNQNQQSKLQETNREENQKDNQRPLLENTTRGQAQTKQDRKNIIICFALVVTNQGCGINSITFYAKQLFMTITNNNENISLLLMILMGLVQIIAVWYGGRIIDRLDKKKFLLGGQVAMIILLFLIYIEEKGSGNIIWVFILIILHSIAFSLSIGQLLMYYCTKLLINSGNALVANWIGTFFIAFLTYPMLTILGLGNMCFIFCILLIVTFFLLLILLPKQNNHNDENYHQRTLQSGEKTMSDSLPRPIELERFYMSDVQGEKQKDNFKDKTNAFEEFDD